MSGAEDDPATEVSTAGPDRTGEPDTGVVAEPGGDLDTEAVAAGVAEADGDLPAAEAIPEPAPVTGPGPRRWRSRLRAAALPAAFIAAIGLAGGLGWQLWQQHLLTQAGNAGRQAAVDYAEVLTSIDSNNVDENFDAVLNGATGDFKDTYSRASQQLRQLLIDNKATAQGTVVGSAVQSQTRGRVVVLLMVDQTVTNTARPDPRVDRNRMKMTMDNVEGRWLASKVELP